MRFWWTVWMGVGCGGSAPDRCDSAPRIEVGTGEYDFEPIASGGAIDIVHGPQGGYHIVGAIRACNLSGPVGMRYVIVDEESGETVTDVEYLRALEDDGACCGVVTNLYGYLWLDSIDSGTVPNLGEALDGHPLTVTMTVTDADGVDHVGTGRFVGTAPQ